jgi:hypothetical protein
VMNLQFSILMAQSPRRQIRQAGTRLRDSSHERLLALTPGGARSTARRMAEAGGVSRRAAPSQSLKLHAGSTLCTLCLRRTQPQPDGAEAQ